MHKGHMASGVITGTGAAINVSLGFTPSRVRLLNQTQLAELEWVSAMPAAAGLKRITAGTMSYIVTGGISAYAGDGSTAKGFTLGTDAFNAAANVIHYIATSEDA